MTLSYCGETVRKHDPDRFLLSLFAPSSAREALWALYAFNHEIARTREVVTETKLGLIRLQWWRDEIARIYESRGVADHQVLKPLAETIAEHHLPRELFDNLIYAREFDLEDRQPANLEGMIHYADFTSTPLMELVLTIYATPDLIRGPGKGEAFVLPAKAGNHALHVKHDWMPDQVRHGGVASIATAYALTGLLRAVPFHLSQRRCYLPADMTPLVHELYEGKNLEGLKPAVKTIVTEAEKHLLPSNAPYLRLHAKLAAMYLAQIKSVGYDLFSPRLKAPPLLRELRLWLIK